MSARIIFVTGTGTGIGKTWVTARLLESAKAKGLAWRASKPVQSFEPGERTDAEVLGEASGQAPEEIAPRHRWYGAPLAPPMAAELLGREPFSIRQLAGEIVRPEDGILLVEGAGGPRSPLADDGDSTDLIAEIGAERTILVADAELGTINASLLAAEALEGCPVTLFLNRYDDAAELHRLNASWLRENSGFEVITDVSTLFERLEIAPEMEAG